MDQGIQSGSLDEAPSSGLTAKEEAVGCACELLGDSDRVSAQTALLFLPWLVAAAPEDALVVLQVSVALPCRARF